MDLTSDDSDLLLAPLQVREASQELKLRQQQSTSAGYREGNNDDDDDDAILGGRSDIRSPPPSVYSPTSATPSTSKVPPIKIPLRNANNDRTTTAFNSSAATSAGEKPFPSSSQTDNNNTQSPKNNTTAVITTDKPHSRSLLEQYLSSDTAHFIIEEGWFAKRPIYQDDYAELKALEQKRGQKFVERYEVVQKWPDWRQRLHRFVKRNRFFEGFIFVVIMLNCATISTDNFGSASAYGDTITVIDNVIVWIYFIEMLIKMVALGVFVRRWGYFHSKWNVIDCAISVVGVITFFVILFIPAEHSSTAKAVARALRILRPFRILTALSIFRTVLRSIANALIRLTHMIALSIVFTMVMGLIALHFFHGTISYRCHSVHYNPFTEETLFVMEDEEAPACSDSYLPPADELTSVGVPVPSPYELPWGPNCYGGGGGGGWPSATPVTTPPPATTIIPLSTSNGSATLSPAPTTTPPPLPPYDPSWPNCSLQSSFPFLTSTAFHANTSRVAGFFSQAHIRLPKGRPRHVALRHDALPSQRLGLVCPYSQLCLKGKNPSNDRDSFDDVLSAFLLLYTILCLEAWSSVMYYIVDAQGLQTEIYFVILVIVGAVVILNLALTIITDAFSRSVAMEDELRNRQAAIRDADREEAERAAERLAAEREELAKLTMKVVEAQRPTPSASTALFFRIKEQIYAFMRTNQYVYFLSFLSFINIGLLASIHIGMDRDHFHAVDIGCRSIACLFLADGFVFALSSPFKRTLRSPTTLFRLIVGAMAVLEWFMWDSGAISAFFAIRILQPMRRIKSLRVTFALLYKALKTSFTLIGLLFCVMFLFAIIGMQLFAGKLCGLDSSSPLQTNTTMCDGVPRTNFDNVGYGIVTVFIIVVGDGWRGIMNDSLSRVNDLAALYFCLCYLIGGYLIMNLFVAVLFSESNEEDDGADDVDAAEDGSGGNDETFETSTVGDTVSEYSSHFGVRKRARSFAQSMIVDRIGGFDSVSQSTLGGGRISEPLIPFIQMEDCDGVAIELTEKKGSGSNLKSGSPMTSPRGGGGGKGVPVTGTFRKIHQSRFRGANATSGGSGTSPLLGASNASSGGGGGGRMDSPRNRAVSVIDPTTNQVTVPGEEGDGNGGGGGGGGRRGGSVFGRRQSGDGGYSSTASFSASKKWSSMTVMNSLKGRHTSSATLAGRRGSRLVVPPLALGGLSRGGSQGAEDALGADNSHASAASFSSALPSSRRTGARWRNDNDSTTTTTAAAAAGRNRTLSTASHMSTSRRRSSAGPLGDLVSELRSGGATTVVDSDEDSAEEEGIDDTWDDLGDYFTPIPRSSGKRRRKKNDPAATGGQAAVAMVGAAAAAAQQQVIKVMSVMEQLTATKAEKTAAEMSNNRHLTRISRVCGSVVMSRLFSWGMLLVILFSMVSLAMVDPLTYPDSRWNQLTIWSDFVCGSMFFIEFLLKLGYLGFYTRSSSASGYFNSPWNIFDCCLMVIGLCPAASPFYSEPSFNEAVALLRVVRAFRPFSFVGRHSGLELIFHSFIISLPAIGNISVIVLLVWFVFAVAAMQIFGGMLWACTRDEWGDMSYNYPHIRTEAACLAQGYTWTNHVSNYDHFGESLLTLLKVASNDNWHAIMFAAVDTVEVGQAPIPGNRPWLVIFFIVFIVLESFFLINFFISVMVETYFLTKAKMEIDVKRRQLEQLRAERLLDDDGGEMDDDIIEQQVNFANMYRRALIFVKPPLHVSIQMGSIRHILRRIARSRQFEFAYLFFAFVHTCLTATQHMEKPPMDFDAYLYIDMSFTIIFWLFVAIKMKVLGFSSFFEQNTRRTEVLINLLTSAGVLGELAVGKAQATTILRLCRVLRLYRTIYLDSEMRLLVDTITVALPSIVKVFFILMMTFYLFAVIGMSLFGRVKWNINKKDGSIGNYANFQRLDSAFMVLLRVATLDDWAELMGGCSVQAPDCSPTIGDCGMPLVASVYFCLLVLILQWIGLNFFTAALMDAFSNAEKEDRFSLQKSHIDDFRRKWKELVGMDTTMPLAKLQQFIAKLGPPLGPDFNALRNAQLAMALDHTLPSTATAAECAAHEAEIMRLQSAAPPPSFHHVLAFLTRIKLPIYEGTCVSQSDVFDALVRYYYGVPMPRELDAQLAPLIKRRFEMGQFERHVAMVPMLHGAQSSSAGKRVMMQDVAAAAIIQARWRGTRVRRIVQETLAEHRKVMLKEGISMAHIQQAKRDRAKRERLLARPMGVEVI